MFEINLTKSLNVTLLYKIKAPTKFGHLNAVIYAKTLTGWMAMKQALLAWVVLMWPMTGWYDMERGNGMTVESLKRWVSFQIVAAFEN